MHCVVSTGMTYQLEEPFFEDNGKITAQKEIGDNKTQMTFSSIGTLRGNIEVTNSGDLVSQPKGNKGISAQGQGVVTTKDGSERANYTFLQVGKTVTKDGKSVLHGVGSAVWSTSSNGKLAFLDNMLSIFIIEVDEMGNFSSKERTKVVMVSTNSKFFLNQYLTHVTT